MQTAAFVTGAFLMLVGIIVAPHSDRMVKHRDFYFALSVSCGLIGCMTMGIFFGLVSRYC